MMNPLFRFLGLLTLFAFAAFSYAFPRMAGEKKNSSSALSANLSRNSVNLTDKNAPTEWNVEAGKVKNIKWVQDIGDRGYGAPVVSGGRVFFSTTNKQPRDPKVKGDRAILMCFSEKDGKFLWQADHDMAPPEVDQQAKLDGLVSVPAVEGNRVYYVTPGCQVVCADVENGKAVWTYDLMKELKVFPCIINSCSPLVVGDLVYVVTGNGIGENGVVEPKAPSFVALEKQNGKLKWQSALPGDKIIHGQWASAAYAEVNGKGQVIWPGGDGYLYSLEPLTGALIWKFRCTPIKGTKQEQKRPNYIVATPVVQGTRVYVSLGNAPDTGFGNTIGHLFCVDITKKGDVSPVNDNFDPKAPENKNSALIWHFGGVVQGKEDRSIQFGPTLSSCAVNDGLLYITDESGFFYCLDAATGQKLWDHDLKSAIWGSPYWVDGKVYIGAEDGGIRIFLHGRQKKMLPEEPDMDGTVQSTAVMANGVLYIATKSKLYAIAGK